MLGTYVSKDQIFFRMKVIIVDTSFVRYVDFLTSISDQTCSLKHFEQDFKNELINYL